MIAWILFSVLSGILEAKLFHNRPLFTVDHKYIHVWFTLIRLAIFIGLYLLFDWNFMYIVVCSMCFPFFHDGAYYLSRNLMNPKIYRRGWKDRSRDTNALISLKYDDRLYLLLLSGMLYLWIWIVR